MTTRFLPGIARCIHGAMAALVALTVATATAQEKWYQWDIDFDEGRKPWKEIEASIPAYPRPEDLIPFEAAKASGHRYFVDGRSLSLGEDGVMRYVLVIKAAGGATNVTFEGIRCDMRQQKIYAVGHANGGWSRARDPRWRRIGDQEASQHGTLYDGYFCSRPSAPATPSQALQLLKSGGTRFGGPMAD